MSCAAPSAHAGAEDSLQAGRSSRSAAGDSAGSAPVRAAGFGGMHPHAAEARTLLF
jgi:hypothetical protein